MTSNELLTNLLAQAQADASQYKYGKITITAKIIQGTKVGYAGGSNKGANDVHGYIAIDQRFVDYAGKSDANMIELVNTVRHELAHLIAETNSTKKGKKGIWHGQAWKDVFLSIGGDGSRYYSGSFTKPENVGKVFKSKAELALTLPKQPASDWERGTYRQWLERGYHVIKGQKGQFTSWEFSANEYETDTDGKTSNWGRASAVYFNNDQVEPNQPKEGK